PTLFRSPEHSTGLSLGICRKVSAFAFPDEHHPSWIGLLEVRDNLVIRHIRIIPALPNVFHVPSAFSIELMKERIVPSVEFQRMHPEPLAEAQIECGCCFHPPALQIKFREAVPDEEVSSHQLEQLLCGQMVAHIGIA